MSLVCGEVPAGRSLGGKVWGAFSGLVRRNFSYVSHTTIAHRSAKTARERTVHIKASNPDPQGQTWMRRSRKRGRRKYGGKPPKPTPKPKREATPAPILALPTELLAAIFSLLLVPDVCRTVCRGFSEAVRMIPFVAHELQLQMVRVWNQNDFRYTQDRVPPSLRSHFQPRRGVVVSFDPQLAQLLRAMHAAKIDLSRFFSSLRTKKPVEGREPPTDPFRDAFCGGIPFPSHKWFDEPTNAAWFAPFDVTARGELMDSPVFGSVRHFDFRERTVSPYRPGRISYATHMEIQLCAKSSANDGGRARRLWQSVLATPFPLGDSVGTRLPQSGGIAGARDIATNIAFGPELHEYVCSTLVGERMPTRARDYHIHTIQTLTEHMQTSFNQWLHNPGVYQAMIMDAADQGFAQAAHLLSEDSDSEDDMPSLAGQND